MKLDWVKIWAEFDEMLDAKPFMTPSSRSSGRNEHAR